MDRSGDESKSFTARETPLGRHSRCVLRQSTSNQWSNNATELRNALTDADQSWTFGKWCCGGDDRESSILQPRCAHTLYGSPNDEHLGRSGDAAKKRAKFEQSEERDEDPFVLEVDVKLAGQWLHGRTRELICCTVPAYVCQRVEIIGDLGDCLKVELASRIDKMRISSRRTVAMIEISSSTRKNVKHMGVINIQSFSPETHCTSLLRSSFGASDMGDFSSAFESRLSSWFCEGGVCCLRSGEAGREDAIVDGRLGCLDPGSVVFEGDEGLAEQSW